MMRRWIQNHGEVIALYVVAIVLLIFTLLNHGCGPSAQDVARDVICGCG